MNHSSNLPRTLEPESMETNEEAREYREMDHSVVNQVFVDDLMTGGPIGPRVLDLGSGPAHIPVLLCQSNDDVEVMAVDSSVEMLELARIEIELGGVADRIQLEHADAKTLEGFEAGSADTVISNSLLHHLENPGTALASAIRMLCDGGRLFVRDLMRPADGAILESLVEQYTRDESPFAQQLFRQSLHAALTLGEIRQLAGGFGIPSRDVQMSSDRHWTIDWTKQAA